MNNLDKYLCFISGDNHKKLYRIIHEFVDDIRKSDNLHMMSLLMDNCVADISMIGKNITGKEKICSSLIFPDKSPAIVRLIISNVVTRQNGINAYQFAQLQSLYAIEENDNVFPFCYGAHLYLEYQRKNTDWKIAHIKVDMNFEAGNNAFVKGKWHLMDYSIFSGHEPMINTFFDAPWKKIPVDTEPISDEETIYEILNRYYYDTDDSDWGDLEDLLVDDIVMDMSARANSNKNNPSTADSLTVGKFDMLNWDRGKHHKEAKLQHTAHIENIVFNEDHTEAILYGCRSEFHRLYREIWEPANIYSIPFVSFLKNCFRKENEVWKISKIDFIPHLELVTVPEDYIEFDRYICGEKKNDELQKYY